MIAVDLLADLRARGFVVAAEGSNLSVGPRRMLTDADRQAIRERKPELLAILHQAPACPGCGRRMVWTEYDAGDCLTRWWCERYVNHDGPGCGRIYWLPSAAVGVTQ